MMLVHFVKGHQSWTARQYNPGVFIDCCHECPGMETPATWTLHEVYSTGLGSHLCTAHAEAFSGQPLRAIAGTDNHPPALLPCPFCGGEGHTTPDRTLRDGYEECIDEPDAYAYNIRCRCCAAEGGWGKSPGSAVMKWNMREPSRAEQDRRRKEKANA